MSITIDENMLSPKARQALNNAKNKSKLLRDAFEAYINLEPVKYAQSERSLNNISPDVDLEIKNDIKDIKEILINLSSRSVESLVAATLENKNIKPVEIPEVVNNKEPLKEELPIIVDKPEPEIRSVQKGDIIKPTEKITTSPEKQASNYLSEERKREIERMYDFALDNFGE